MAYPVLAAANERGKQQWSPYTDNGGSVIGLAGDDYVVVAGDTRMSRGYNIMSRDVTKLIKLNDQCVLGSAGMQADRKTLHKLLAARIAAYEKDHNKPMSAMAVAEMLSRTLYYRRFFPYYTFNLVAGLDENGKGFVCGYDAIGSHEKQQYTALGSGSSLIMSLLDNQVGFKTQPGNYRKLSAEEAVRLVQDCFICADERDIYTGDYVEIFIIKKDGVTQLPNYPLKKD